MTPEEKVYQVALDHFTHYWYTNESDDEHSFEKYEGALEAYCILTGRDHDEVDAEMLPLAKAAAQAMWDKDEEAYQERQKNPVLTHPLAIIKGEE